MGAGDTPLPSERGRRRLAAAVPPAIRLLRPHHWIKNAFVLLPVPFALAAGSTLEPLVFALGFVGFCLLNSAVYVFNDLHDAEADRASPRKRHRPIASGAVSSGAAWALAGGIGAAALALGAATGLPRVLVLFGAYAAANLAYSLGLKHVPLLDVFVLASGFVIRVLLGCALVQAPPSAWLLLCTSALALFLAFGKRRGDLLEGLGADHRPALAGYSLPYLDAAVSLCAGVALVSYALYCLEGGVLHEGRELAGLVFVAFCVFEYLRLAYTRGAGASPVGIALTHRPIQAAVVLWLLATLWSLGAF
jgi:4-hydroxybenzoate polyprenyltransferase